MRIDRRLTFVGIMLIVLSMTMATQYATTKIGYSYNVVHPSNADIRFIASDNSSDGKMVLRIDGDNSSGQQNIRLVFGNWSENQNKTFTAAFAIVNEERFKVNITHINVTASTGADYMQIWLHGNRDEAVEDDTVKCWVWNKGAAMGFDSHTCVWQLGAGNQAPGNMSADGSTAISTPWNSSSDVRYSLSNVNAVNGTSDFVWVQISLNIPDGATAGSYTGSVWIHVAATTHG